MTRRLLSLSLGLGLSLAATANAQTADGQTPAAEDICTKWGMTGKINGLCNACQRSSETGPLAII